ncbi:MAG: hypothetical protein M3346_01685 [Actinomycetota bacterium]|nr:hypothetical protein [Actinomycetota bacterium]
MPPLAHETWFTDDRPPYSWAFTLSPATLLTIAAVVGVAIAWRLLASRLPRPELSFLHPLGRLSPWVPRLLAVHAGVSLLAQAASGSYLAPALELPRGFSGTFLALLEGITGVWLISGYGIRPAAWLLVASGPLGIAGYGIVPILERIDLLGIALFLALLPPDDRRAGGTVEPSARTLTHALLGLRVLVGGALVVLAFTEKLARPDLALAPTALSGLQHPAHGRPRRRRRRLHSTGRRDRAPVRPAGHFRRVAPDRRDRGGHPVQRNALLLRLQ